MSVKVVIGMGFGDEGKGVVTDYLCSQDPLNTLCVRFSGGHQCGHKVVKGDVEHIFSNFGCGVLAGCPTYWSKYCTFEPVGFMKEYKILRAKGIKPVISIHPDAPVVTPYDIYAGQNGIERQHGTCGTGFYRTKKRHFQDEHQYSVDALFSSDAEARALLRNVQSYYNVLEMDLVPFWMARLDIMDLIREGIVTVTDFPGAYPDFVFEGNQGLMLDQQLGYMPHCTPSDCTPRNVLKMGYEIDEVYLVSRVYQTRHGNGPMTNENLLRPELINTEKETNTANEYQGVFRRTILDLSQLIYAKIGGIDRVVKPGTKVNLVLTCTDQVKNPSLTLGSEVVNFGDMDSFAYFIAKKLGINGDVYTNSSPLSSTIRKL
jgi:adenylosuccinate synthase